MAFQGSPFIEKEVINGRVEGSGRYEFENGNVYVGEFKDGRFHGKGTLYFTDGIRYEATWENGKAIEGTMMFEDGLVIDEDLGKWDYCTSADRRYYPERVHGITPANGTQVTVHLPQKDIPQGSFDVVEGYFNPTDGWIYSYAGEQLRKPEPEEMDWIQKACFKNLGR